MRTTACVEVKQRMKTIEAEGCVNRPDKVEQTRSRETAVAAMGVGTGGTNDRGDRCTDCNNKTVTAVTLQTKCGDLRKPISGMVPPFVTKMAPTDMTGEMHYQWIARQSVRTTAMLIPSNYLEIPEMRLPRGFLHLAEEARNVEIMDDLSYCSEEIQPQRTGLDGPILVTDMVDRQPMPIMIVLTNTDASAEMMTNEKYVGRCKPIDRADQVASPLYSDRTRLKQKVSADTGGSDVKSAKQREPVSRLGPVGPQNTSERPVWLDLRMNENEKAPVNPLGQTVNLMGQNEPVGPQNSTEQSALLRLMTDGTKNTVVCHGGPDVNLAGRGEPVNRSGSGRNTDQSVLLCINTDKRRNAPNDPVGHDVMLAGRGELVDRPDRVGPYSKTEQSVFLRSDVDQVEHISANIVHPGVKMSRSQPVTDGPADPVRTCRPVGTEWRHAEDAVDRPTAGDPVVKLFNSDPLCPSGMSLPDELYPPLALGPMGQPFITGPLGDDLSEPYCTWRNRSYGGPEGSTGVLDAVYQTGHDVQTDRLRIGSTNGQASSGNIPQSCDSGVHSWNEQWEYMSENSTYSASAQTVGSDCEGSGRVPLIEIRAPSNTEEEEDSDYPSTDGLLSGKCSGGSSQVVYSVDGRIPYCAVTECVSGRITDIAVLSDFSDDSVETGVRQLSKCRVPVTVQPMLPAEDVISVPWDQPVDPASRAIAESRGEGPRKETLIDGIPSSMHQWDKRVLPGLYDPEFESCTLRMMDKALARDADHRLDKTCPEFIQYMIKSIEIYRNTWDDHDVRLKEEGTICTAPGCQCHVRIMFPLFPKGKETVDSRPAGFTDGNRRTFVMESTDSDSDEEVPGTYTPPPPPARETRPEVCKSEET